MVLQPFVKLRRYEAEPVQLTRQFMPGVQHFPSLLGSPERLIGAKPLKVVVNFADDFQKVVALL